MIIAHLYIVALSSSQHPRIMFSDDVVHLFHQVGALERDMCRALLKVANRDVGIVKGLAVWLLLNVVRKPVSNIRPVIGYWLAIQQVQHTLQVH